MNQFLKVIQKGYTSEMCLLKYTVNSFCEIVLMFTFMLYLDMKDVTCYYVSSLK